MLQDKLIEKYACNCECISNYDILAILAILLLVILILIINNILKIKL